MSNNRNRSLHELTYDEVFENTILKVELALGHDVAEKIYIEAEIVSDIKYLGCCFIKKNDKAHVVYYPGIPHSKKYEKGKGVPLEHILKRVDDYLEENHPDRSYHKHITVGVDNITYENENDFVAITEINNELCTIFPRKLSNPDAKYLTNDEFKYLEQHVPKLSKKTITPHIGGFLDRASNGYRIASIHADSVVKTCTAEAIAAHETEYAKKWFYENHPVLTGILAGLVIAIFISLAIYITIMTAGGFGIVLGGAITTAATVFGASTVATVFTSILMGLGLGSLFAGIGGSIGAALDSSCSTQKMDAQPIPINDKDVIKPESSQAIIHKAMNSGDSNELVERGDYFCEQGKYSVAIMYYADAYHHPDGKNMQAYYKREYLTNMLAAQEYAKGNDIDSQFHCKNAYNTAEENYKLIKNKGAYLPKPEEFNIGNAQSNNNVLFGKKEKHENGHKHGEQKKVKESRLTTTSISTFNYQFNQRF